jgi:2-octaprenyl-6-methoxyphenol hydroxylase
MAASSMSQTSQPDVIVAGAGLAGLTCALALSGPHMSIPLKTMVIDAGPTLAERDFSRDTRGSAITLGSRSLFEALDIWPRLQANAQPFNEIIVTNADRPAASAPVLLNFTPEQAGAQPSAWMLENGTILSALAEQVSACENIEVRCGETVAAYDFAPSGASVQLQSGATIKSALVVAADGRNSTARQAAGIDTVNFAYGQSAITATIGHTLPHHGRAEEHFRRNGPLAILPLTGNRFSLVWVETDEEVARLMSLDDKAFSDALQAVAGDHLGELSLLNQRTSWPLKLQIAKKFASDRLCLIGDAAHVIHPIAGLGFNLGLKDIAALAECVSVAVRRGQDIGCRATVSEYESWRRADTAVVAAMCDGLARLFSNDITPLSIARQAGLQMVNKLPPLKSFFMESAAGTTGRQPALMSGSRL